MKAYGIPRTTDVEFPDCADLIKFALAGHVGHLPEKCGCYKNNNRSSLAKRRTRRIWKKKLRAKEKRELNKLLIEDLSE